MVEADLAQQLVTPLVKIGEDEAQKTSMGKPFPLVLSPVEEDMNFIQLQEYFIKNHENIRKAASEYGAVMFSGFNIRSGNEWASVLYQSGIKEMEYVGGAAVRNLIIGNDQRMDDMQVLTTNESPPSEPIPLHHELAQTPNPPSHICFMCQVNKAEGGSTPILRSDAVYNFLQENHPEFLARAEAAGVKYRKVAPEEDDASSALGRSWKSMYNVGTKEEAEAKAAEQGSTLEWLDGGNCRVVTKKLEAVQTASNGNKCFFNQIVAAYTGWTDSRNTPKEAVVFADDDSFLPDDVMTSLVAFMEENKVCYKWVPGKFVICDNTVTAHSRQPFKGRRKTYAAIGKGVKPVGNQTHLVLRSGDKMPSVGFGIWQIPRPQTADCVYEAIKAGYRCIDSAPIYLNEIEAGQGIKRAIDEGIVKREDLFITTKLWNAFHRPQHVRQACQKSLTDLGLDYVDLFLIHFPCAIKYIPIEERYPMEWGYNQGLGEDRDQMVVDETVTYEQTYHAIEKLQREGLTRNIGISNLNTMFIHQVLKFSEIKPAVLQNELHPYLAQQNVLRLCAENGIQVTAYSSLGGSAWVGKDMASEEELLWNQQCVKDIAARHQKTCAQVLYRWALQRGTQIIPKSTRVERIHENIQIFDFNLSNDEMKALNGLNRNRRYNDPGQYGEEGLNCYYPIYD